MHPTLTLILLATVPLAACTGGAGEASRFTERDSAGVRIATTSGPGWPADRPDWRVAAEPTLEIGTLDGDPEFQLDQVRGLTRMSDGRIAVALGATQELRFFGADGSFQGRAGRKGGGPGEFEGLSGLWRLPGDTLVTWDHQLRRVSRFGAHGGFIGSLDLVESESMLIPQVTGVFHDGTLLVQPTGFFGDFSRMTTRRDTTHAWRYDADGNPLTDYGPFPGREETTVVTATRDGKPSSITNATLPFGRQSSFATDGELLWVATADHWQVEGYDREGVLRRIIRRDQAIEPLPQAAIDSYIERDLAQARERGEAAVAHARIVLDAMEFPSYRAPYDRLVVGAEGDLWLHTGDAAGRAKWAVFTPQGRYLGELTLPPGLHLHEVGADYVLGTWHDDLGVTYVRLHRLER